MPKDSGKLIPVQKIVGLQVIDTKGSMIGNVKDISVDFDAKSISFGVTAKNSSELDFTWDDVQSVEDVVLLKKEVDLPSPSADHPSSAVSPPTVQPLVICPSCGASTPAHAKFCSKCGTSLK
ncbi:MAG TPA: zinc-ribbon domain-containing protein [Candidatus Acidoferrales bacterium]|nr:zinc-ribbon domain-containing protein [Candidatus Acidoferrales bacterium]